MPTGNGRYAIHTAHPVRSCELIDSLAALRIAGHATDIGTADPVDIAGNLEMIEAKLQGRLIASSWKLGAGSHRPQRLDGRSPTAAQARAREPPGRTL